MSKVCFVFLDGVGLGEPGPQNPLSDPANVPFLTRLLGSPPVAGHETRKPGLLFVPLDACLGVPGLPQSATGQTALFTGANAPAILGHHASTRPGETLQAVIAEKSVLKQARDAGFRPLFANAFTKGYWERAMRRHPGHSASTLSAMAAGIDLLTTEDLARGRAVYWDITHEVGSALLGRELPPPIPPEQAGQNLARLMDDFDLVLFESFLTDLAGHGRLPMPPSQVVRTVDRFLKGLLENLSEGITLVLSSDHGNLEDVSVKTHTRNPVPLLVVGPGWKCFLDARAITDVTPGIMATLRDECRERSTE